MMLPSLRVTFTRLSCAVSTVVPGAMTVSAATGVHTPSAPARICTAPTISVRVA